MAQHLLSPQDYGLEMPPAADPNAPGVVETVIGSGAGLPETATGEYVPGEVTAQLEGLISTPNGVETWLAGNFAQLTPEQQTEARTTLSNYGLTPEDLMEGTQVQGFMGPQTLGGAVPEGGTSYTAPRGADLRNVSGQTFWPQEGEPEPPLPGGQVVDWANEPYETAYERYLRENPDYAPQQARQPGGPGTPQQQPPPSPAAMWPPTLIYDPWQAARGDTPPPRPSPVYDQPGGGEFPSAEPAPIPSQAGNYWNNPFQILTPEAQRRTEQSPEITNAMIAQILGGGTPPLQGPLTPDVRGQAAPSYTYGPGGGPLPPEREPTITQSTVQLPPTTTTPPYVYGGTPTPQPGSVTDLPSDGGLSHYNVQLPTDRSERIAPEMTAAMIAQIIGGNRPRRQRTGERPPEEEEYDVLSGPKTGEHRRRTDEDRRRQAERNAPGGLQGEGYEATSGALGQTNRRGRRQRADVAGSQLREAWLNMQQAKQNAYGYDYGYAAGMVHALRQQGISPMNQVYAQRQQNIQNAGIPLRSNPRVLQA
jgi:hypothetical protein